MQQEILSSISERGPDRSRCIVNLLFENHLEGKMEAPSWKELWQHCWDEPLDSRKGADVQRSANVRQAVYRLREILDRFFEEPVGRKWRVRASIQLEEYRLVFESNRPDTDEGTGPPMLGNEEEPEEE